MAIAKVIEVIAESDQGWDHAAQVAVADAAQSVRGIKNIFIKNMSAVVQDDRIVKYRVNANITFVIED
jgi:flavin-binding protein dodecin